MARPPKEIDYDLAEELAKIHCTDGEIATLLGMTAEGFCRRKKRDVELYQRLKKGNDEGRKSLRRMQYDKAEKGDTTMLIWLGKQLLGQKDKSELSGDAEAPLKIVVEYADKPAGD